MARRLDIKLDVNKGFTIGPKRSNRLRGGLTNEGLNPMMVSGHFFNRRLSAKAQFAPAEWPIMMSGLGVSIASSNSFKCLEISSICNCAFWAPKVKPCPGRSIAITV